MERQFCDPITKFYLSKVVQQRVMIPKVIGKGETWTQLNGELLKPKKELLKI